jgi:hypothetical protein
MAQGSVLEGGCICTWPCVSTTSGWVVPTLLTLLVLLVQLCLVTAACLSDFTLCSSVVCNSGVEGTLVVGTAISPTDTTQYHRVDPLASVKRG